MGGGNGQKAATARARKLEKLKEPKGSQLKANAAALSLKSKENVLKDHQENKHPKSTFEGDELYTQLMSSRPAS
eukprot:gene3673-3934_t